MENFRKVVRLGTTHAPAPYSIYCRIEMKDNRLSISGVEGPLRSGNARGGCGQIEGHLKPEHINKFAPGWTHAKMREFLRIWGRWHLNDMRAGSPAQEAWVRDNVPAGKRNYETVKAELKGAGLDPDNGYSYGSKWLAEEIPSEIADVLRALAESDKTPAWV